MCMHVIYTIEDDDSSATTIILAVVIPLLVVILVIAIAMSILVVYWRHSNGANIVNTGSKSQSPGGCMY